MVIVINFLFIALPNAFSQEFKQLTKIVSSDRNVDDNFGNAVAIYGDYAIVGAMYEDDDENSDNKLLTSGSAYVFKKDDSNNWEQYQKIVAEDRQELDRFGNAVAISDKYLVVGAYFQSWNASGMDSISNAGAVYVYEKQNDGDWSQMQKLVANDRSGSSNFGFSVAISDSLIIVGAYTNSTDENDDNSELFAGAAYIFKYQSESSGWIQMQKLVSSDRDKRDYFGYSVAISDSFAFVSANAEDEDENGDNTLSSAGSAYIFKYNKSDNTWSQTQKIVASDRASGDGFGRSVAMNGSYAIVGAYKEGEDASGSNTLQDAGSAYIFSYDESGDTWSQTQKVVASDRGSGDNFGSAVSLSGKFAIVGAYNEDEDVSSENSLSNAGSAYCFECSSDGNWQEINKIVPDDRCAGDAFGYSVAINDSNVIAGAIYNDYDASDDDELLNAGSAYFFANYELITTDISNSKRVDDFSVYPNPASDKIFIKQNTEFPESIYAYFYDVTGQLRKSSLIEYGTNVIELNGLLKGIYILKIKNNMYKILIK